MEVTETVVVAATPERAWGVVGDVTSIARWVPGVSGCRLDRDVRRLSYVDGGQATERIVEHDDAARTYVYDYLTGRRRFDRYRSRLSVRDHAHGAEVVWTSAFTVGTGEADSQLAAVIGERYRSALHALREEIEA